MFSNSAGGGWKNSLGPMVLVDFPLSWNKEDKMGMMKKGDERRGKYIER